MKFSLSKILIILNLLTVIHGQSYAQPPSIGPCPSENSTYSMITRYNPQLNMCETIYRRSGSGILINIIVALCCCACIYWIVLAARNH